MGNLLKKNPGPQKNWKWPPKNPNGRHKFSFSQLAPQQLTNNEKNLSTPLKHFEKKSSKTDYFRGSNGPFNKSWNLPKMCFSLKIPWNLHISILVKEQILCKHMFYTNIPNFMQILLVAELLPLKGFDQKMIKWQLNIN